MIDATRREGILRIVVVAILLLLLVGWLAFARPDTGTYALTHRVVIHGLWVAATYLFGRGVFLTITGAPGSGPFVAVRGAVGWLVGITCALGLAIGAFVLHLTLTYDRSASSDSVDDIDWDWD